MSGEKLAEAELLYVDPCHHKDEECRKRVVRNVSQDDNELVSLIRDLLRNCSRNQATIENSGNRDSGNFGMLFVSLLLPLSYSPSAESRKFGFMAHSRGTAETCHILIFDY